MESRLAASLDHSHVVPIYEAGEVDGDLYLAMRYVEGTTLRDVLRHDGPLEPTRALDSASRSPRRSTARTTGISCIATSSRPTCWSPTRVGASIVTSATSASPGRRTQSGRRTVSPERSPTTAPEQISGGSIDGRADQYALACVLCECLTGQPPFPRAPAAAILFAHLSDPPASLHDRRDELPESIDAAVGRALAKEPDERYATCRELIAETRTALGLDTPRLSRRALFVAAGAAAAVTAAAAIPAILLTRGNGSAQAAQAEPLVPVTSDAVIRIDPAGTAASVLDVPSGRGPLAFGEGSIWLADKNRRTVSRIDPAATELLYEIATTEKGDPAGLAVGDGTLWIFSSTGENATLGFDDSTTMVRKYDLRTGHWSDVDLGVTSEDLVVADGALWSVCTKIVRVDIVSERVTATLDPGLQGKLVAAGEGAVWFSANKPLEVPSGSRVWRIDPATNTLGTPIEVEGTVADLAVGEGEVWTLILEDDLVRRIDPVTFEVSEAFRVGRIPEALAVGEGAVWVAASRDGTVTRFDLSSADLKTIEVGGAPRDLVTGGGSVWAAVEVV